MKYLVYVNHGQFYLDHNLEFRDKMCDACVWYEDREAIEEKVGKDAQRHNYQYIILPFCK